MHVAEGKCHKESKRARFRNMGLILGGDSIEGKGWGQYWKEELCGGNGMELSKEGWER